MDAILFIVDIIVIFTLSLISRKFSCQFRKLAFLPIALGLCMFLHGPVKAAIIQIQALADWMNKEQPNDVKVVENDLYVSYVYEDSLRIEYGIGKFRLEDSPKSKRCIEKALKEAKHFCDSIGIPYPNVEICIIATADGIPTRNTPYKGDFGPKVSMEYEMVDGSIHEMILIEGKTPMENINIAGSRAYPVKKLCEDHFGPNNSNIRTVLHCFKNTGHQYRKVIVCFRIKNIYNPCTRELNKLILYGLKEANIKTKD